MKCLYVYNPTSGKQNNGKNTEYIVSKLKTKYEVVDVMPTKKRGDAGEFACFSCGKYDTLVISGGDGTVNEVVNALACKENRPVLGYIPAGTINDLAHSLKIPKKLKNAVNIILNGNIIDHDIFKVNNKYGIYVCAFGLFTASSYTSSQKSKKKFGKLAYYINGIKELKNAKKFNITLKTETIEFTTDIILGIIANSKYVSGYKINKMANCSDGYVNVILYKERKKKGVSLKMLFNIFRSFLFGMGVLKNSKNCVILKLNKFEVDFNEDTDINLDGEKGMNGSFKFEVLKQHLKIFVKG